MMTEADEQVQSRTVADDANSVQLLTFILDSELFGVDISHIQEVLEYRKVTRVPRTPDFLMGVLNLRGRVVPVVDLRRQFDMTIRENTVDTCIIIIDIELDGEQIPLGILADSVREVVELSLSDIDPPPRMGTQIDTRYISGMGKMHDEFIIILNLVRVFADDELHDVFESAHQSSPADASEGSDPEE